MSKPHEVGTRFPFINLEKALARAEQLYQADPRGRPVAVPTAFAAWGYSDKSSGGHQTVAALKMYGLIADSGANADRRVALSEEALRYFADERDNERKRALRQFAITPKLAAALWRDWGVSPPADNVARSHLKIDRKMNEQSAKSFLSIYKDNVAFADLRNDSTVADSDPAPADGQVEEPISEPALVGDLVQWSPGGVDQFRSPVRVRALSGNGNWLFVDGSETGIPIVEVEVVRRRDAQRSSPPVRAEDRAPTLPIERVSGSMKRDVFSLDEGEVTITFPATLTRASYDDFVDWLELVKRKAERAVQDARLSGESDAG